MGLKKLKSQFDLVKGPTSPVGNMESTQGPQFDNGVGSQLHINSLSQVPTTSPFQDLDGNEGPQFDLGPGSTLQPDSLSQVPTTSPYQDLDGVQGPQFDSGIEPQGDFIDTLHERSLTQPYNYQHGGSPEMVNPTSLDLNGDPGPQFDNGIEPQGDLVDTIHERSLTQDYTYNHGGTPGLANASTLDLDGLPDPLYNTLNGTSDSPFNSRNGTGDHMVDLLTSRGGSSNSGLSYKPSEHDLNGGNQPPYNDAAIADQKHQNSLTQGYAYTYGNSNESLNSSQLDLDGLQGPQFNNGPNSQLHNKTSLIDIYNSPINPLHSYGAGQPGGNWPSVNPSVGDLDGNLPSTGEYDLNKPG
tara:strand:- start:363 stop:1430 length:1068 start_codon:yes stop_codon:yes gene_type:complete